MLLPGLDTMSMGGLQKSYTFSLWQHGGPMIGPVQSLELGVALVLAIRLAVTALLLLCGIATYRLSMNKQTASD